MKFAAVLAALAGLAAAAPQGTPLRQRSSSVRPRHHSAFNKRLSKASKSSDVQYSGNWAGAVNEGNGWNYVQGTITVPSVSGSSDSAASAWVGIDGDSCQTAILQTGVSFYGDGSFDAWYEWIPDSSISFNNFGLSVGDQIQMIVDATSAESGVATLENLTTGQKVSHKFSNPPSSLCQTDAEWIVEDFESGGSLVPFANFGSVTFTDASAKGSSGTVTPGSNSIIIDIKDENSGQILTDCGVSGGQVTCQYTGSS